jgi:hypothetical protein
MRKRIKDDRLDTVVGDVRNSRSIEIAFQKHAASYPSAGF